MDQNYGNGGPSEDTSRAEEHVRRAEENRDALAAQHQRTEETTPADVDMPSGMSASRTSRTSDDASEARANVQNAEANRDALEAQNDRVERTTSEDSR